MDKRTIELRRIMHDHGLSAREVAKLLGRSVTTVRIWRCASLGRVIPEHSLQYLRLLMATRGRNEASHAA
jgi:transcriptional regulator with XRE-family HTH domain